MQLEVRAGVTRPSQRGERERAGDYKPQGTDHMVVCLSPAPFRASGQVWWGGGVGVVAR